MKKNGFLRILARKKFERLISDTVRTGTLILDDPDGMRHRAGDGTGIPVHVRIASWQVALKIALNPDMALGEAYMNGDVQMIEGSIYDLLDLVFANLKTEDVPGVPVLTRTILKLLARFNSYNSPVKSKDNVAHHYDLDGRLYDLFLDGDRQYSCGYFESPDSSLEDAQLAKKRHLAAKLNIGEGQSILDIGSGWGGLALYLSRLTGAHVQGVTLSEEQLTLSRARAAEAKMQDRVRFDLQDYRSLNTRFDRIVSVGMFEHVGRKSYGEFFSTVSRLLDDNGVAVLHYIGRTTRPFETNAWILKYIFPGGYMPSLSEVLPEIERHGLIVTDIEVLRLHYADTLRAWRENFLARQEEAAALYDDRFVRMWEFYLAASETAFRHQGLVIHQIQMVRDQDALPRLRDYITSTEHALKRQEASLTAAECTTEAAE